jgi:hypothetical protein
MPRKKTGGRQKGTPNKTTGITKKVISGLLERYSENGKMDEDFMALKPRERIAIAEKLMQYVLPKMQSTSVDMSINEDKKTIDETLRELAKAPDEDKI